LKNSGGLDLCWTLSTFKFTAFPNLYFSDFGRVLVSGSNGIGGYVIGEQSSDRLTNGVEQ